MNEKDSQDYIKFIKQKYSAEDEELNGLIANHSKIRGSYNKIMNQYKIMSLLAIIPNYIFTYPKLIITVIWRLIINIKELHKIINYDEYYSLKLNEALDMVLNGYKLSEQEQESIINIYSLPRNTEIEKYIYEGRLTYIQTYLHKQLLPFWQDKLTPECIEFVITNIEKGIKATNEFIAKEDIINQVYYTNPRPITWREQLIDAGIPIGNE